MKLQDIAAERRAGCFEDGRPYDTWCVFLSFRDGTEWKQFALFLPPDCEMDGVAEALRNAAEKLSEAPDAKPRP